MTQAFAKQILQGVAGPATAVDNAVARFDGVTGKKLQSSDITIDDAGNIVIGSIVAGVADYDKFIVSDGGQLKFRTGAEVLSDIGAAPSAHLHDGDTLQPDGINSDGGDFLFDTGGTVKFNKELLISNSGTADLGILEARRRVGVDSINFRNSGNTDYLPFICKGFFSGYYATVQNSGGYLNAALTAYRLVVNRGDIGTIVMGSGGQYGWANAVGFVYSATNDTGLARNAAAVVKVTNGAAGWGSLLVYSLDVNGILKLLLLKSGATQAAAGAAANEVWKTSSHASLPDNVLMVGV